MDDLLQVGVITSTHGLKGEVKIFPTTDDVNRFKLLKTVLLDNGTEKLEMEIESIKFFKQYVILKFKGINDINDVEKYKNKGLFVSRENAVELQDNEYFITDLIGLNVITDENITLGVLTDVMVTGANDVYVVQTSDEKEILLPAIKQCILEINIRDKYIKVHVMKGLI